MKKDKSIKLTLLTVSTVLWALAALISAFSNSILSLYLSNRFNLDVRNTVSVGVVGGTDGPAVIFLSGNTHFFTALFAVLAILGAFYLVIAKRH